MDGNHVNQIQKLMHELPTGVNLSLSEWMNSEIVTENSVGFVFFVVSAEVLTNLRQISDLIETVMSSSSQIHFIFI